jgi:hypothetical protein
MNVEGLLATRGGLLDSRFALSTTIKTKFILTLVQVLKISLVVIVALNAN